MTWVRPMAVLAAAALEGLAAVDLLRGSAALALAVHLASCGLAAGGLWPLVGGPALRSFGLLFGAALLLPVLGTLGLAALGLAAARSAFSPALAPVGRPAAAAPPSPAGAFRAVSRGEARTAELMAVRELRDPGSIALLRCALDDPHQEVRLLARSLLEGRSAASRRAIAEAARALEGAAGARGRGLHRRLADEHRELARLGLVQGDDLAEVLERARAHDRAARGEEPGAPAERAGRDGALRS